MVGLFPHNTGSEVPDHLLKLYLSTDTCEYWTVYLHYKCPTGKLWLAYFHITQNPQFLIICYSLNYLQIPVNIELFSYTTSCPTDKLWLAYFHLTENPQFLITCWSYTGLSTDSRETDIMWWRRWWRLFPRLQGFWENLWSFIPP